MMRHAIVLTVMLAAQSTGSDARAQQPRSTTKPLPIRGIAFSPDGKLLAIAAGRPEQPGSLIVWDVATHKPRFVHAEKVGVCAVAFSPNGALLAVGTFGMQARLIDVRTGKVKTTLAGNAAFARSIAFGPNGRWLVTGGYDRTLQRWDVRTGKVTGTFKGHTDRVYAVAVSSDGEHVASASQDRSVRIWELDGGESLRAFEKHETILVDVSWSKNGRWLLTGCWDGIVRIYDASNWRLRGRIQRFSGVKSARLSPDGTTLAVCDGRTAVQLFQPQLRDPTDMERKRITGLIDAWRKDDIRVRDKASAALRNLGMVAEPQLREQLASQDAEIRIRARRVRNAIRSPEPHSQLKGHRAGVNALAFSPDGRVLATGDESGVVKLWNVKTHRELATIPGR